MKRFKLFLISLLFCGLFALTSCDPITGKKESGQPVTSKGHYNGKPILTVTPTSEGLLIQKNHNPAWCHVTIHVEDQTSNHDNARIDGTDQNHNEFTYPFVQKGHTYRLYIEKQEDGWTNWGTTDNDSVFVTAIGGKGDYCIFYNKSLYDPKTFQLTLKGFSHTRPNITEEKASFNGPVFNGQPWSNGIEANYNTRFVKNGEAFDMSSNKAFLQDKEKIGLVLSYSFDYAGVHYNCLILSKIIYQYQKFSEHIDLNDSDVDIPSVYITSTNCWKDKTAIHFSDQWKDATIKISTSDNKSSLSETSVKIKDRGNSTKWTGKAPYSLKLESKTELLGMKKAKRWVLMANYYDRSLIRTQLAGYIDNNIFNATWNASFTPVNLYINGEFAGTYDLGEANKIAKQRVNIQSLEDFADKASDYKDVNGDGKVDIEDAGFMVEIDSFNEGAERIWFYSEKCSLPFTLKEPDFGDSQYSDEKCNIYKKYAKGKIDAFEKMLFSDDFASRYEDYIDLPSFVDWYLVNEFSKNSDAIFQKSVYVYYDPADGKLRMGPNWDFDLAFGNFWDTSCDDPKGWYIHGGRKWINENHTLRQFLTKHPELGSETNGDSYQLQCFWINRLFEADSFKQAVKQRWQSKSAELKAGLEETIPEYAGRINKYIPENEARLKRLGVYEWNGPNGYEDRTEYADEIDYLYNWCLNRWDWMNTQIINW